MEQKKHTHTTHNRNRKNRKQNTLEPFVLYYHPIPSLSFGLFYHPRTPNPFIIPCAFPFRTSACIQKKNPKRTSDSSRAQPKRIRKGMRAQRFNRKVPAGFLRGERMFSVCCWGPVPLPRHCIACVCLGAQHTHTRTQSTPLVHQNARKDDAEENHHTKSNNRTTNKRWEAKQKNGNKTQQKHNPSKRHTHTRTRTRLCLTCRFHPSRCLPAVSSTAGASGLISSSLNRPLNGMQARKHCMIK